MRWLLALIVLSCSHPSAPAPPPASAPAPVSLACCQQCAAASRNDPAGVDIGVGPCTKYRGAGVDDACAAELAAHKTLVRACWEMTK